MLKKIWVAAAIVLSLFVAPSVGNAAYSLIGQPMLPVTYQSWIGGSSPGNGYKAGGGATTAPTVTQVATGACTAISGFFKTTYVYSDGESLPSPEKTFSVSINNVFHVANAGTRGMESGWNVYASTTTGTELLQNSTPIPSATSYQEVSPACLVTGTAAAPTTATVDLGGTTRAFYNVIDGVNQIRILYTNFYLTSAGETNLPATPGSYNVQAEIEDPANPGTPYAPVTFEGASTGTVPLYGFLLSDPIDIDLTSAKSLWVRTYTTAASGIFLPRNALLSAQNNFTGIPGFITADSSFAGSNYRQSCSSGTSANNLTTAGTAWIPNQNGCAIFASSLVPTTIIGQRVVGAAPKPVFMGVGDSIMWGIQDTDNGGLGWFLRWINAYGIPGMNLGGSSETMTTATTFTNYRDRMSLSQYGTAAAVAYGVNDIYTNLVTLAAMKTNAATVYQRFVNRGLKVYAVTIMPNVTCSPDCSTTANQSQTANQPAANVVRVGWNDFLRSYYTNSAAQNAADPVLSLISGVIDVANTMEVNASNVFTVDGGFLYCGPANNTAYMASDGLHPMALGNAQIATTLPAATSLVVAPAGGASGNGGSGVPGGAVGYNPVLMANIVGINTAPPVTVGARGFSIGGMSLN